MSQDPGLSPHQQPPLPLTQMREDRLEFRRQQLPGPIRHAYAIPQPSAKTDEPTSYLPTSPSGIGP